MIELPNIKSTTKRDVLIQELGKQFLEIKFTLTLGQLFHLALKPQKKF
jgi:hypothetical protein